MKTFEEEDDSDDDDRSGRCSWSSELKIEWKRRKCVCVWSWSNSDAIDLLQATEMIQTSLPNQADQ